MPVVEKKEKEPTLDPLHPELTHKQKVELAAGGAIAIGLVAYLLARW